MEPRIDPKTVTQFVFPPLITSASVRISHIFGHFTGYHSCTAQVT
jgi:hypothetical protein